MRIFRVSLAVFLTSPSIVPREARLDRPVASCRVAASLIMPQRSVRLSKLKLLS
jgi:hypothetical protein